MLYVESAAGLIQWHIEGKPPRQCLGRWRRTRSYLPSNGYPKVEESDAI